MKSPIDVAREIKKNRTDLRIETVANVATVYGYRAVSSATVILLMKATTGTNVRWGIVQDTDRSSLGVVLFTVDYFFSEGVSLTPSEPDWYDWERHHGSLLVKNLRSGVNVLIQGEDGGQLEDDLDRIVEVWHEDPSNTKGRGPRSLNEHLDLILSNYFGND